MFSLKPKEDIFFELFIKAAKNAHTASKALSSMLNNFDNIEESIQNIIKIESEGDSIKYEIEKKLLDTFITPFDREDIYLIAKKTDKYVNNIQTIAFDCKIYHIEQISEPAKEIASKLVEMTEHLIVLMENLKEKSNSKIVKESIININIAESVIFPLPAPGSVPVKNPIPWDANRPYKGLGFRSVDVKGKEAQYGISEFSVKGEKL
jgi:predicted phosphate transport protein (TIGR00153 family)